MSGSDEYCPGCDCYDCRCHRPTLDKMLAKIKGDDDWARKMRAKIWRYWHPED